MRLELCELQHIVSTDPYHQNYNSWFFQRDIWMDFNSPMWGYTFPLTGLSWKRINTDWSSSRWTTSLFRNSLKVSYLESLGKAPWLKEGWLQLRAPHFRPWTLLNGPLQEELHLEHRRDHDQHLVHRPRLWTYKRERIITIHWPTGIDSEILRAELTILYFAHSLLLLIRAAPIHGYPTRSVFRNIGRNFSLKTHQSNDTMNRLRSESCIEMYTAFHRENEYQPPKTSQSRGRLATALLEPIYANAPNLEVIDNATIFRDPFELIGREKHPATYQRSTKA